MKLLAANVHAIVGPRLPPGRRVLAAALDGVMIAALPAPLHRLPGDIRIPHVVDVRGGTPDIAVALELEAAADIPRSKLRLRECIVSGR